MPSAYTHRLYYPPVHYCTVSLMSNVALLRLLPSLMSIPPLDHPPHVQASSEVGDEVQLHSLMSKIALLCLHFPRLRLIWSRSLHATADIFAQLKANQDEPDPVTGGWVLFVVQGGRLGGACSWRRYGVVGGVV